jgi:hypothetical protein
MAPSSAFFCSSAVADMLMKAPVRENAPAMLSGSQSSGLAVASTDIVGSILSYELLV